MGQTARAQQFSSVPLAPPDRQPANLVVPTPVARKAGWAVVGLGELALGEGLPAFRECQYAKATALVSGHPDKAGKVAVVYGVNPKSLYTYETFDHIANNPEIDVVYIVLPNPMHAEFSIRALKAGKHVLCEKPLAANVKEAEEMVAAARTAGRKLGTAYRLHYEPMNLAVMDMCRKKTCGDIKTFTSSNCQNVQAPNIRLSAQLAGGPVGDMGIYSINAARYALNEEPIEVAAMARHPTNDPRFREVPESVSYLLRYPSGIVAQCECSFGSANSQRYRILCTKGFIEMDPAFPYRDLRLRVSEETSPTGVPQISELRHPPMNQFARQFDHFSQAVLNNTEVWTTGEMGLADMRIVAAIDEAQREGRPVKLGGTAVAASPEVES
jgi:predicted dehydrogenase